MVRKKLKLDRSTLRTLSRASLARAFGGTATDACDPGGRCCTAPQSGCYSGADTNDTCQNTYVCTGADTDMCDGTGDATGR
jgi:hypothetical protein